ncbi:MAG: DUF2551 domain-containing protein [Candidatus Methanoperedens sp.]|nr:DUF2551 domain-containing protein [Candidatus Methanoperedens sp.]HLB70089.1 DUF2551 domain-containing protein [Candidatus Methanoperedens sp.]
MGVSMAGYKNEGVKIRLRKFLLKDKIGIRKSLLIFFLQARSCTTGDVYDYLVKEGFNVSYKAVSAMVGQMHSRLGILRIYLSRECNVYSLKEEQWDIVKMVLNGHSGVY